MENELIPVVKDGDNVLVSGRVIYQRLGLAESKFNRWSDTLISQLKLEENLHFLTVMSRNFRNDYLFPMRIAQVIVLMQGNDVSKIIWQQLVKQESVSLFKTSVFDGGSF